MSHRPTQRPAVSLTTLAEKKALGEPIVMVTAYDFPSAQVAEEAGVDVVLVGDSAAMTVLGHDSTVPATMDEMIVLTRAANRGARRPLVVADMPFGSFQVSDDEAGPYSVVPNGSDIMSPTVNVVLPGPALGPVPDAAPVPRARSRARWTMRGVRSRPITVAPSRLSQAIPCSTTSFPTPLPWYSVRK